MNIKSTAHCQTGNSAVGVVYVLLNFLYKDGDEPDALEGDKDEEENKEEKPYDRRIQNLMHSSCIAFLRSL